MALPTQKRSKSRKKIKQYSFRLKSLNLSNCPKCKKPIRSHHVCLFCGTYNSKEIIKSKTEKDKKKKTETKEQKKQKEKDKK